MASLDEVFPPPAVARHKAPKRPAPADAPPAAPWHGDFAGNATDGLLLMGAAVLLFCVLSGKWWIFRSILFFGVLGLALFFWSLYIECAQHSPAWHPALPCVVTVTRASFCRQRASGPGPAE